jgi:putative heme-binding domain-containing protein
MLRRTFLAITLLTTSALAQKADPFAEGVRTTEPLEPAEQRGKFKLPPGFEIQLVAAEPDLRKPMNMAFDATGRLWVSESREYPFPAKEGAELRDSIRIFSDFRPDGRARKMEVFADKLNIPIGLYPFRTADGHWKCVAWSIPNIWLFEDTDGDGKADKREVIFGPLGWERDTHGNQASFRRGDDGWIYATHGFNNNSVFKAKDGSSITLNSGNVYRFRLDGSRVEQWTHGQVNPYGLCWDDYGNLFSADCHSSPIYQLLRGGYYPSFGKPHDGLGFAPQTIQHSHGSTAICGPMLIRDTSWPAEYQGQMLVGNVMTSRINRDRIEWRGSSSKGIEMPDFLTSEDPWFRPVDLQWGPDGALYIADFYNRIIGHYEVPLTHPGRDRERGRIWRVVYKGAATFLSPTANRSVNANEVESPLAAIVEERKSAGTAQPVGDKSRQTAEGNVAAPMSVAPDTSLPKQEQIAALIKELGSSNPTRRSLALNELCDRFGKEAVEPMEDALSKATSAFQKASLLHALSRLGGIKAKNIADYTRDPNPMVRAQALKVARGRIVPIHGQTVTSRRRVESFAIEATRTLNAASVAALSDPDALVRRNAAETLAAYPLVGNVAPLLSLLRNADKADDHLIYSTRVALREHLRDAEVVKSLNLAAFSKEDLAALLDIMPAVPGEHAALLRLELFEKLGVDSAELAKHLPGIIKNAPAERLNGIAALAQKKLPGDAAALTAILTALDERGVPPDDVLVQWAGELVPVLLSQKAGGWEDRPYAPNESNRAYENPWTLQDRKSSDGQTTPVMSSFPKGEKRTGVLRSAAFAAPEKLRFYLCGHDGTPPGAPGKKNFVRLIAEDGAVLREAAPPRNDTAQRIEWDLADVRGKMVRFEATDGDSGEAYAWLAFGRFKPELPELALGGAPSQKALAAELAGRFKLVQHRDAIAALLNDRKADVDSRAAAAKTLVAFRTEKNAPDNFAALSDVLKSAEEPDALREKIAVALGSVKSPSICQMVADAMPSASAKLQQSFATALSANRCGTVVLIKAIEDGKASPQVLRDKATVDRLRANAKGEEVAALNALLAKLPPANVEADKLIAERRANYKGGDIAKGADVFKTHCAVCHQIGQQGALVGPQLDGIGGRGLDRIIEDILDPNRNVDRAFRLSIVTLKDGGVASGLLRREEGGQMVLADIVGKESSVPLVNVAKREENDTSLMPAAFDRILTKAEFNDLVAFLLSQRPK